MKDTPQEPVAIPVEQLSEEVLQGIIEEFVLREGTDYGHTQWSLEEKVEQVHKQLARGQMRIMYDPKEESCTIVAC